MRSAVGLAALVAVVVGSGVGCSSSSGSEGGKYFGMGMNPATGDGVDGSGGVEGAGDGADAADGTGADGNGSDGPSTDGASDGNADGAADGTDGTSTDGSDDGTATDGADGADGATDGDDATDGGDDTDGSAGDGSDGSNVALADGCEGQKLRAGIPDDLSKPGPWPVGALTTTLGDVTTEVWYPAKIGSVGGKDEVVYDIREHLPDADQKKLPSDRNPWQPCNCYRDLPLDTEAGPYPVLLFIHGTAGFRTTNLENVVHWASRGFIVVAADHPGIRLKDMLGGFGLGGASDQSGDARAILEDLATPSGDVAFLKDHLDMTRVGVMGHSAGAGATSSLGDVADVLVPYAGGSAITADRVQSVLFITGDQDGVVAPGTGGFDGSTTKPKRLAYIAHGGHLVGGSLCKLRDPTDKSIDIVDLANEFQLGNAFLRPFMGTLFDGCNDADPEVPDEADGTFIAVSRGIEILSFYSTGVFEESLHCSSTAAAQLAGGESKYGDDVSRYDESLP